VIEDAAQAHGAKFRGRVTGGSASGRVQLLPDKELGRTRYGGAVTTDDPQLAARLRRLRNYGSEVKYIHSEQGTNSRLDELQAAVLRVKLRHLAAGNSARRALAARYHER